jgi:demethylmenaquinone methyltransferase/2-methoxy-6-polyprenyl-1,4-benzoquinol methylase
MTELQAGRSGSWDNSLQKSYDEEARHYDARRYRSAEGQFFSRLELQVLDLAVQPKRGMTVLDLPAGTGRISLGVAASGARVVGGDISQGMLRMAASKAPAEPPGRVSFAQMNAEQLPFADATFDVVTSFKFFHLIPNEVKPQLVREMARVLKPGGRLVAEFNSPFYGGGLAFLRYYFRKQRPGGMRMKCLFPDQVASLFSGLVVTAKYGVKLPLSGALAKVVGSRAMESLNLAFGRIPGVRYFAYAIIVVAEKPRQQ